MRPVERGLWRTLVTGPRTLDRSRVRASSQVTSSVFGAEGWRTRTDNA